jgi:hypothetical protein
VLTTSVAGDGKLNVSNLSDLLYPDMVTFVALYCSEYQETGVVQCCTEVVAHDGVSYHSHPNYQQNFYWHDWAWVKFVDKDKEDVVPSKLLCFLPHGIPGVSSECHVVCHPCQWKTKKESLLVDSWTLMPCNKQVNNGIPYEMVPLSSIDGHCMVVSDRSIPGRIVNIKSRSEWPKLFWKAPKLFK